MMQAYPRRVLTRAGAFAGAAGVTGALLALQGGALRGAIIAALYLAALFAPAGLLDALLIPMPRSGPARLGRIALLFGILIALSAASQWRALAVVPSDLQTQIAVESLMRDVAFLGAYLLLEVVLGSVLRGWVPV